MCWKPSAAPDPISNVMIQTRASAQQQRAPHYYIKTASSSSSIISMSNLYNSICCLHAGAIRFYTSPFYEYSVKCLLLLLSDRVCVCGSKCCATHKYINVVGPLYNITGSSIHVTRNNTLADVKAFYCCSLYYCYSAVCCWDLHTCRWPQPIRGVLYFAMFI